MKRKSRKATPRDLPSGATKAFLESGGHIYLGKKLQPYTPSRVVAAQAMGLLYPKIGDAGLAQFKKTGLYPGELKDIIIVLWLCRLEKDEEVTDALMDPLAAYGAAEKWAGKAGMCNMTSEVFGDARLVFMALMSEIGESKTKAVESRSRPGGSGDEEADDPNG